MIWLGTAWRLLSLPLGCTNVVVGPAIPAPVITPIRADSLSIDTLNAGRFGPVVLYRQREHPSSVVLFVSGDGGWNLGVVRMAEELAGMDALVAGIDIRRYLRGLASTRGRCSYPAADFEALSQWLQRRLGYPAYVPPVLVGYSSGATLAYGALAQAPPNTFRGAISLGFCPELQGDRRFCSGKRLPSALDSPRHRIELGPADSLAAPWIVLQGESDSTCVASRTEAFVRKVPGAAIMLLPEVGHGFGVERRWMPQLQQAFRRLGQSAQPAVASPAPAVRDLPLVELKGHDTARQLALIVSGDGGWASLDREIGETIAAEGVPVVGLNSLQYFWKARTPDEAGADLTRILRHYLQQWHASELILVGYSRGADVLPFMVSRLPGDLRERVRVVALLGPGHTAGFEWHLSDLLGTGKPSGRPTVPEISRLRGLRVLCVYGSDETDSACPLLPAGLATVVAVRGGHHFGGAYREIAQRILEAAGSH